MADARGARRRAQRRAGIACDELKVDGGMTVDELLMQFQADVLGVPTSGRRWPRRRRSAPPTPPGSPSASWSSPDDVRANWREARRWEPAMDDAEVERRYARWREAVERSLGWSPRAS